MKAKKQPKLNEAKKEACLPLFVQTVAFRFKHNVCSMTQNLDSGLATTTRVVFDSLKKLGAGFVLSFS